MSDQLVVFIFNDNVREMIKTKWSGDLPRKGEHIQIDGDPRLWGVALISWAFRMSDKVLERGARIYLVELDKDTFEVKMPTSSGDELTTRSIDPDGGV